MKKVTLLLCMGLLLTMSQAQAGKGGGGSSKGGFGDLGDGCLTFVNPGNPHGTVTDFDAGTVHDDDLGSYCNGTDGQVSVPWHLRFDTKKFNPQNRHFRIWGNCVGEGGDTQALCQGPGVDGLMLNLGVGPSDSDWSWTQMSPDPANPTNTAVDRMGIKIDKSHFLYFDPNPTGVCLDDTLAVPESIGLIHIRCNADANGDDLCDQWTISTDPAFPTGNDTFSENSSRACFRAGAYGSFYNHEVVADFTMEVCVMGSDFVGCP
jgi:hypothetical protein